MVPGHAQMGVAGTRKPLKRRLVALLGVACFAGSFAAHAAMPIVSKVRAAQRPGTKLVDIYYDVSGTTNDILQVSVAVSTNGGVSYALPAASFSGPGYGASVVPGSNRQIIWDAGADWNTNHSANISFRVTASDNSVPATMAFIPAGPFQMGDALNDFPIQWHWGVNPEIPVHTVHVSAFFMDQYEVTKARWDEVHDWATNHGYRFEYEDDASSIVQARAPNHPVTGMSWWGLVKWCNARSEKEGLTPAYYTSADRAAVYRSGEVELQNAFVKWNAGYRLPTEAEWEKAARGGASGRRYPWVDSDTITHSRANYVSNTNAWSYDVSPTPGYHPDGWNQDPSTWPGTTPVGHFAPNGYGLYDMAGNVWEWCWNWTPPGFGEAIPYGTSPETDPRGLELGLSLVYQRAVRGGSWMYDALYCRLAFRYGLPAVGSYSDLGFRCVLPGGQPSSIVTAVDTRDIPQTVSGRIRSAQSGAALAGVTVTLGGQTVTTGPDGSFTLPNITLASGNTLSVASAGFAGRSQTPQIVGGSKGATLPDLFLQVAEVTNRPVVTDIAAQWDGVFLAGASFLNQYTAIVNWNGFTPARVEFYIRSTNLPPVRTVTTSSTEAMTELDMGQWFVGSYTPGANKLWAVAVDGLGQRSDPFRRDISVVPIPGVLQLSPLPAYDPLYDWGDPPEGTYRYRVKMPPDLFPGSFSLPMDWLAALGLGLNGDAKLTYRVPGNVWVIGGDQLLIPWWPRRLQAPGLSWGFWNANLAFAAAAQGYVSPTSGIEVDEVSLFLHFDATERVWYFYVSDYLPYGQFARVVDILQLVGVDPNSIQRLDMYGLLRLDADLVWSCRSGSFREAIVTPGGGVRAMYAPDLYFASLQVDVTGTLDFPLRLTEPQAWKVTGEISFGVQAEVLGQVVASERWAVLGPGDIVSSGNWGARPQVRVPLMGKHGAPVDFDGVLLTAKSSCPRPMDRDYLKNGPARFLPSDSQAQWLATSESTTALDSFRAISRAPVQGSVMSAKLAPAERRGADLQAAGGSGESSQVDLTLLQNVFPHSQPAIDSRGQELMLLFVADNGGTNRTQFTDIEWTRWDGTNWSVPLPIRANTQGEFAPQVKFDGNGDAVAVWQRVADPGFTNLNLNALAAQMEIVWSRWSAASGAWSEPVALTANSAFDHSPQLCGPMAGGNLLLTWIRNDANLLMATNAPGTDTVLWREWSATSGAWSVPHILVDGLAYRLSQSLAGRSNVAAYAWTRDVDGVLTNDLDQEVFYVTYTNGAWTAARQFTTNSVPDKNVRLAVSGSHDVYLVRVSGTNLMMSRGFSGSSQLVRADSSGAGFADFALTLGPADNLVLLWQEMSPSGSDAHYAVFDPISGSWSRDDRLSQDAPLERSFAPVWDNVGNLTVAYDKQQMLYTNLTIALEGGGEYTLTNVPQRGRVDLVVTKRALIKDLAIEAGDLGVAGVNYLPGDPLRIEAIVRNRGNIAVSNVVVGFYTGPPDAGGLLLTNVTLSGWIGAVTTNVAEAMWVVPEPAAPHVLYAVVNYAGLASEFNETNNLQSVSIGGTDLAVSLVSYQAETNGAVRVYAQVQNRGAPAALSSVLAIRREGVTGAPLATTTVPSLEPGQLAQIALDLPAGTQPEGPAAYRLFADDTHANREVNPNNNATAFAVNLWLDADRDGMPDGWESRYAFLSSGNAGDAALDYDGDGLSNLAEFLAGTAPDDPLSYLRLTSITAGGVNGVQITWGSAASKVYSVQRSLALGGAPAFATIAEHLPSTPPENSYLDPTATNSAAFFYRIRVE